LKPLPIFRWESQPLDVVVEIIDERACLIVNIFFCQWFAGLFETIPKFET
jgi:hypothetical protein